MPKTQQRSSARLVHVGHFLSQVLDQFEQQARIDRILPLSAISAQKDYLKRLGMIRAKYRLEADAFGAIDDPYFIDWTDVFTPIEAEVWGDIRSFGLDFVPQYPVGRFYADFADPTRKIVIECDGEAFHRDQVKDAKRDDFMRSQGWRVFRLTGRECVADKMDWLKMADLRSEGRREDAEEAIDAWLFSTSEGFFYALTGVVYGYKHERAPADRLLLAVQRRESIGTGNKKLWKGGQQ